MLVTVNGKQKELTERISVGEFLVRKQLDFDSVVVEHNRIIVPKEAFETTLLEENDHLEVLRFVGGG